MLAVEKENLLAETNRDIANLRQTEFRYYVDHIGGIQTIVVEMVYLVGYFSCRL